MKNRLPPWGEAVFYLGAHLDLNRSSGATERQRESTWMSIQERRRPERSAHEVRDCRARPEWAKLRPCSERTFMF